MKRNNIVIIGASTGGPAALNEIFSALPVLDASFVIIQHVPLKFDRAIAERLDELSPMSISLAETRAMLKPGQVYLAPARRHLRLVRNGTIELFEDDRVNGCCPAIDVTMKSLIRSSIWRVFGVVLTGMGKDGAAGIAHIKDIGGTTIAQDKKTSVIYNMPMAAQSTGKVDYVLPKGLIAGKLASLIDKLN
jgi:two-component system chemotaxis response regulator CheB